MSQQQQVQLQKILQQELSSHPQTKKKKITKLEQLCPIWCTVIQQYWNSLPDDKGIFSRAFRKIGLSIYDKYHVDITRGKYCFVGEAWKFNHSYSQFGSGHTSLICEDCENYSYHVFYPDPATSPSVYTDYIHGKIPQDLNKDPRVQSFIQHWNENHLDIKSG